MVLVDEDIAAGGLVDLYQTYTFEARLLSQSESPTALGAAHADFWSSLEGRLYVRPHTIPAPGALALVAVALPFLRRMRRRSATRPGS
jgi:hypothetical protein